MCTGVGKILVFSPAKGQACNLSCDSCRMISQNRIQVTELRDDYNQPAHGVNERIDVHRKMKSVRGSIGESFEMGLHAPRLGVS